MMCLCCFAATTSFIVVSMHSVIRGFGFNRRDAGEAMIPIAGKGQGRHQPQLTVETAVCASWPNNRPVLGWQEVSFSAHPLSLSPSLPKNSFSVCVPPLLLLSQTFSHSPRALSLPYLCLCPPSLSLPFISSPSISHSLSLCPFLYLFLPPSVSSPSFSLTPSLPPSQLFSLPLHRD